MSQTFHMLPVDYKERGEQEIQEIAQGCGLDDLSVEWTSDRIIVTVHGQVHPLSDESDSNVLGLARAIQRAWDVDTDSGKRPLGAFLTEQFELEVTTPGASNELQGVMFEAYRGFDVICQCQRVSKKTPNAPTVSTVTGRLVERTEDYTILNIHGRRKKIHNDHVLSVSLPEAKLET